MLTDSIEKFYKLFDITLIKLVIDGTSDIIGETKTDGSKYEYLSETISLLKDFF